MSFYTLEDISKNKIFFISKYPCKKFSIPKLSNKDAEE
jgi:hypothetical protein